MNGSSPVGGGGGFQPSPINNQQVLGNDQRPAASTTWGITPGDIVSVLRPPFYPARLDAPTAAGNPMLGYPNPTDASAARLLRSGAMGPFATSHHHHHLLPSPYQLYAPGTPLHMAGSRNPYLELLAASGAIPRYHRYLSQSPSPRIAGSMPPPPAPGHMAAALEHQRSQSDSDGLIFRGALRSFAPPKVLPRTAVGPILPLAPAIDELSSARLKTEPTASTELNNGRSGAQPVTSDSSVSGANLPTQPYYPSHFMRGTVIQLASGELKSVEELNTEDFIRSASLSSELKMDSSTVVKIEEKSKDTVLLCFSVGEHKVQVSVEATVEHPFFVIGQGWSSCSPERTRSLYGLACQRLQVGDICISLTHRDLCQRLPVSTASTERSGTRAETVLSSTVDADCQNSGRRSFPACASRVQVGRKRRLSCSL